MNDILEHRQICKSDTIHITDPREAQANRAVPRKGSVSQAPRKYISRDDRVPANIKQQQLPEPTTVKRHIRLAGGVNQDPSAQESSTSTASNVHQEDVADAARPTADLELFRAQARTQDGRVRFVLPDPRTLARPNSKPHVQWTSIRIAPLNPTHFEPLSQRTLQPCETFDPRP